jgi:predicted dehydrogenase
MNSRKALKQELSDRIDVPDDRCFTGFDAYQKVLQSGVDVVVLAEPPHFRPQHLKAAVEAGKHVFCEKPVAVDAPGVRSVLATCEAAKKKNLSIVSGLCWRYDTAVKETMRKVLDGTIGELVNIEVVYNTSMIGGRERDPQLTEMQYQMRNWYCFTWLSGDHNVEQHVHSLDKALWAMRDEPPARAWGLGGRQVRIDSRYGDIYDHHAVVYEYPNGVRVYSYCRQQNGCWGAVTDNFFGTRARCNVLNGFQVQSYDGKVVWRYKGPAAGSRMYVAEHEALFRAIRSGKPVNNGLYMARSTMLAIMGRMVDYTGKNLTWDEAINSKQDLSPKSYAWDAEPPTKPDSLGRYPIAMPGLTPFV